MYKQMAEWTLTMDEARDYQSLEISSLILEFKLQTIQIVLSSPGKKISLRIFWLQNSDENKCKATEVST